MVIFKDVWSRQNAPMHHHLCLLGRILHDSFVAKIFFLIENDWGRQWQTCRDLEKKIQLNSVFISKGSLFQIHVFLRKCLEVDQIKLGAIQVHPHLLKVEVKMLKEIG